MAGSPSERPALVAAASAVIHKPVSSAAAARWRHLAGTRADPPLPHALAGKQVEPPNPPFSAAKRELTAGKQACFPVHAYVQVATVELLVVSWRLLNKALNLADAALYFKKDRLGDQKTVSRKRVSALQRLDRRKALCGTPATRKNGPQWNRISHSEGHALASRSRALSGVEKDVLAPAVPLGKLPPEFLS